LSLDSYLEDLLERALREELVLVNKHIPYRRHTLCELLSMEIPYYVSRDGGIYLIDPRELALLKELAGDDSCNLYLPIIIEYTPSLGESAYVIKEPAACRVIAKLLGLNYSGGSLVIYRSQVNALRLKLRTTTSIVFIPSEIS